MSDIELSLEDAVPVGFLPAEDVAAPSGPDDLIDKRWIATDEQGTAMLTIVIQATGEAAEEMAKAVDNLRSRTEEAP